MKQLISNLYQAVHPRPLATATWLIIAAVLLISLPSVASNELLTNGMMEGQGVIHGRPEVELLEHWYPDAVIGDDDRCGGDRCSYPEFKPMYKSEFPDFVYEGESSQKLFVSHANMFGGGYQNRDVVKGKYHMTCMVKAKSRSNDGWSHGQLSVRVGIHPWGGGIFDDAMIWGKPQVGDDGWIYDEWVEVMVEAPVWGSRGTFAFSAKSNYPVMENSVWVDNCTAVLIENVLTPEPCPTQQPCPEGSCNESAIAQKVINALEAANIVIVFP